jgi:hypothetical protein
MVVAVGREFGGMGSFLPDAGSVLSRSLVTRAARATANCCVDSTYPLSDVVLRGASRC